MENLHSWHKFYTTAGRDGRDKSQLCMETTIWIGIIPFGELWLLQRKEDNQAVIFVICPHNWAFMEACYQLSLGLQVDFSME